MLPARHFPVLLCVLVLFFPAFSFSDGVPEPTATPEPLRIPAQVSEPPEVIQAMIGTARAEWGMGRGRSSSGPNQRRVPSSERREASSGKRSGSGEAK